MMSSSDKRLLKDNYFYKLNGVSKWFINIMIVHVIFSVISLNFGTMYFSGGDVSVEIQKIIPYGDLIFVSVVAMITSGLILGEDGFRKMAFTVPTTRKIHSISNLMLILTLSIFTTISILMIDNFKSMLIYFGKENYDEVYMMVNLPLDSILLWGIKIFLGLVLACLLGYVFSLLKANYKNALYGGIAIFIASIILFSYLGYKFALVNIIIDTISGLTTIEFLLFAIASSVVLSFVSDKIIKKGDVL